MNKPITESGMQFVSENVFHIEKSPQYAGLHGGIRTVEFVRAKGDKLLFVEAKSSFANPDNPEPSEAKGNRTGKEIFNEEVDDLFAKFAHSLSLYSAIAVGAANDGFPDGYKPAPKVSLLFILVIRDFDKSWCDKIATALKQRIRESVSIARIWQPEVLVMNGETAAKRKITVG